MSYVAIATPSVKPLAMIHVAVSTPWRQTAGYLSDFDFLKFPFVDLFIKENLFQTRRGLTFGADRYLLHSGQYALASDRGYHF